MFLITDLFSGVEEETAEKLMDRERKRLPLPLPPEWLPHSGGRLAARGLRRGSGAKNASQVNQSRLIDIWGDASGRESCPLFAVTCEVFGGAPAAFLGSDKS